MCFSEYIKPCGDGVIVHRYYFFSERISSQNFFAHAQKDPLFFKKIEIRKNI